VTKKYFDDLKERTQQLAQATKEIEAKIDSQMWERRTQWELKKDTVISLVQTMDAAKDALMRYAARRDSVKLAAIDPNRFDTVMEAATLWNEKSSDFDTKRAVAALICGSDLNDAFWKVQQSLRSGYSDLSKGKIPSYHEVGAEIRDRIILAIALSRKELGIQAIMATSLSNESSAVPTPD
jgi:hypothetical protein